jgi:hypothetical protein
MEHGGVRAEEDPQPPPVVRLAGQILEHSPARLVDMEVPCCRVAGPDGPIEGGVTEFENTTSKALSANDRRVPSATT